MREKSTLEIHQQKRGQREDLMLSMCEEEADCCTWAPIKVGWGRQGGSSREVVASIVKETHKHWYILSENFGFHR